MQTITISKTYNIDWHILGYSDYGVTNNGNIVNLKRGTLLKKTVTGYSKGYYINKKFITLTKLRTLLIKNKTGHCPF